MSAPPCRWGEPACISRSILALSRGNPEDPSRSSDLAGRRDGTFSGEILVRGQAQKQALGLIRSTEEEPPAGPGRFVGKDDEQAGPKPPRYRLRSASVLGHFATGDTVIN